MGELQQARLRRAGSAVTDRYPGRESSSACGRVPPRRTLHPSHGRARNPATPPLRSPQWSRAGGAPVSYANSHSNDLLASRRGSSTALSAIYIFISSKLVHLLFRANPMFVAFALGAVSNEAVASDLTRHVGAGPNIGLTLRSAALAARLEGWNEAMHGSLLRDGRPSQTARGAFGPLDVPNSRRA